MATMLASVTFANTPKISGDWAFVKDETDGTASNGCYAGTHSPDLQHRFILFNNIAISKALSDESIVILNWIEGPGVDVTMEGSVTFIFDEQNDINVQIDYSDDPKAFQFEMLTYPNEVLEFIKSGSSLSMHQNGKLIAGPISLRGSSKALKFLQNCS